MTPQEFDLKLSEQMARFYNDPHGFVMFAFPWGQPGTALEKHSGPDEWHLQLFSALAKHVTDNMRAHRAGEDRDVWQSAIASGHGIGKSACVAWIILWLMSTRPDCRGIVTANTENQLLGKTWPELSKWHQMAINKHWFTWTASQFYFAMYPEDRRKTYMVEAVTWSENRTEGFAGLHNESSAVFYVFDEASAIPSKLWEVASGGLTDGEPFWFCFGNPTVSSGRFYDCFHGPERHHWWRRNIDSRTVKITNKKYFERLVETYGEDSDYVRVRVRGLFPRAGDSAFIPTDLAEAALSRADADPDAGAALVMGVDVARFGSDRTVICFRRNRDARSIPWVTLRSADLMAVAGKVFELAERWDPDLITVDGVGVGGGLIDRLRQMNLRVFEVNAGAQADDPKRYRNKRAEMWDRMREWLAHGILPNDKDIVSDLTGIEYKYTQSQQLQLESKEDMRKRGLASPDLADALSLTFARNIARRDARLSGRRGRGKVAAGTDYSVLG